MSSTADKTITLITGANCGIGFALCALLLESPSAIVLLGSRSAAKGEAAVTSLKERNLPGTVELVVIDVDSEESVEHAAKEVESKHGRYTTTPSPQCTSPLTIAPQPRRPRQQRRHRRLIPLQHVPHALAPIRRPPTPRRPAHQHRGPRTHRRRVRGAIGEKRKDGQSD
jgi:NAD(P)-dependent dehydrogenase (short-subunit alcohol dehydrogenase family)